MYGMSDLCWDLERCLRLFSGNGVPDILDELRWTVHGLLRMMSPDGGAYHKATPLPSADLPCLLPQVSDDACLDLSSSAFIPYLHIL